MPTTWVTVPKTGGYLYDTDTLYDSSNQYDWVTEITWTPATKH